MEKIRGVDLIYFPKIFEEKIIYNILDSEWNDECIDFTMM